MSILDQNRNFLVYETGVVISLPDRVLEHERTL